MRVLTGSLICRVSLCLAQYRIDEPDVFTDRGQGDEGGCDGNEREQNFVFCCSASPSEDLFWILFLHSIPWKNIIIHRTASTSARIRKGVCLFEAKQPISPATIRSVR